jgi:hypothetical protein
MRGPRALAPHGSKAAARRHYRNGEKPCDACSAASRADSDPYARTTKHDPQSAGRNGLPVMPYQYGAERPSWALQAIRRAEAVYGAPEKDDGAAWDREAC